MANFPSDGRGLRRQFVDNGDGTFTEIVSATQGTIVSTTATVANTASLSGAVSLASGKPGGIQLPANIDSATSLTYQVSYDGGTTYNNFYDSSGNEYTTTVAASRSVPLEYKDFFAATHIKIRLGTSGVPVTATADRVLKLALVP